MLHGPRMRAHLATHPEHRFAVDDIAWSASLTELLNALGVPSAASLS